MFDILAGILIVIAGLLMLLTAVALWRAPDAITRANLLGPTTGVAVPLLVIASLIHDIGAGTFSVSSLIRALIAIAGLLAVLAIGSFIMGRSLYGVGEEQAGRHES